MRFLYTYSTNLKHTSGVDRLADTLINVLALALSTGEAFLPDAKSYDNLFYYVFESGEALDMFREKYEVSKRTSAESLDILINVFRHYTSLLEEKKGKGNKDLSPREVREIIKQGYETLSIQARDGLDHWERYREAEYRNLMKRVARVAVKDARMMLADAL